MVQNLGLDFVLRQRGHLAHQNRWRAAKQTRIGIHGERATRPAGAANDELPGDGNEASTHIHNAEIHRT